ncbi:MULTISPECIES: hypothetical protein [Pseudomonas]|jgi:hypothetical protein|uniref:hypothetical protein n=1 Tax=Pseudomonas TaxID=286 RepID=UPI000578981E|nr:MULTISPECIES: hypothetical protein [Pseudomonas]OJT50908.1 hypothetical protein BSZ28_13735 [Pseudomonas moraviensis]PYB89964.1 hypothetical protein DMX03_06025 [Pseudomonas koreensis]
MSIAPQKITQELTSRLNEMSMKVYNEGQPVNELSWMQLMNDLRKIEDVYGLEQTSLLSQGVLWALKGEEIKAFDLIDRSLPYGGKSIHWLMTRAMVGGTYGRLDYISDVLSFDYPKDNIGLLLDIYGMAVHAGLFRSALHIKELLARLGCEEDRLLRQFGSSAELPLMCSLLERYEVKETVLKDRVSVVIKTLVSRIGFVPRFSIDSDQYGITYEFAVRLDSDARAEMDWVIADALSENFEDDLSRVISFGVRWDSKGSNV